MDDLKRDILHALAAFILVYALLYVVLSTITHTQ